MKKLIFGAFIALMCACTAHNNSTNSSTTDAQTIPYKVAKGYFVRNDVDRLTDNKITTKESLDATFGMATVMGVDGRPDDIDFGKEYVIAVDVPTTDYSTEIVPVSLTRNASKDADIVFTYKVIRGDKQSYSIHPLLMLIVDKQYDGKVVCRSENDG